MSVFRALLQRTVLAGSSRLRGPSYKSAAKPVSRSHRSCSHDASSSSSSSAAADPVITLGSTRPPTDDAVVVTERIEHLHIMTIGLNRPSKRNCVNTEAATELRRAFAAFEADDAMHVAVLHGLGGNFCAGFDLKEISEVEDDLANKIAELLVNEGPMGPTRMELRKPTVAAINGYCVAGGLELALMADLRVVEEGAKIGFLNRRFGVPLIDGGTVRLPELIGLSRALDLILTGRIVEPKEAFDIGLANRIVSTGTAFGQAMNLAKEIVKFPQACLRADRASAVHATFSGATIEKALEFEAHNAAQVLTQEAVDGAKKFMAGLGKHGKFNVSHISEPTDWQKEFAEMKQKSEAADAAAAAAADKT